MRKLTAIKITLIAFVLAAPSIARGQANEARHPYAQTLVIPPYLEFVVFDILDAAGADASATFYLPGSRQPLRTGKDGVELQLLGTVLATLVVPRPMPGEWTIRRAHQDTRVRILNQQFFPRGKLVRPAPGAVVRPGRVEIVYHAIDMVGEKERPLEELSNYPLSLVMELKGPNGAVQTLRMKRRPELGAGVFTANADLVRAGTYWADLRIKASDASGRSLDLFRDRWSHFAVASH